MGARSENPHINSSAPVPPPGKDETPCVAGVESGGSHPSPDQFRVKTRDHNRHVLRQRKNADGLWVDPVTKAPLPPRTRLVMNPNKAQREALRAWRMASVGDEVSS